MTVSRLIATFSIGALAVAAGLTLYLHTLGDSKPAAAPDRAPPFELPDLQGQQRSSTQWAGRVRVINFWATWCAPCRREIPLLVSLQERYGGRGLQIIGIAIDSAQASTAFAEEFGINYPILIGAGQGAMLARAFGNRSGGIPYTALVDADGRIRYTHTGELRAEDIEPRLRALLVQDDASAADLGLRRQPTIPADAKAPI